MDYEKITVLDVIEEYSKRGFNRDILTMAAIDTLPMFGNINSSNADDFLDVLISYYYNIEFQQIEINHSLLHQYKN